MEKEILDRIRKSIPKCFHPALEGRPIKKHISLFKWDKARGYLQNAYCGCRYRPVAARPLWKAEKEKVVRITVMNSQFGPNVEFRLIDGTPKFIPASMSSDINVGDRLNVDDIRIITLYREPEELIYRVSLAKDCPDLPEEWDPKKDKELCLAKREVWENILKPLRNAQFEREGRKTTMFMDLILY